MACVLSVNDHLTRGVIAMKIGILGDLHLKASRPLNRIDDYQETQTGKILQAFEKFHEEGCTAILQPGDFFDSYGKDPYSITNEAIALRMTYRTPMYVVFGQHDVKFHNTHLPDIPIQVLNKSDLVERVSNEEPTRIDNSKHEEVLLYGSSWGEPIPKPPPRKKNRWNILLAHKMIIKNKKLWPGQKDYIMSRTMLRKGFDLIVTGDNHQAFTYKDRLINCGSLMRMKVDQHDHHPMFCIFDTDEEKLDVYYYDVQPSELVLRKKETDEVKESKKSQEDLKQELSSTDFDGELDFRHNIEQAMRTRKVKRRTKQIIEDSIN